MSPTAPLATGSTRPTDPVHIYGLRERVSRGLPWPRRGIVMDWFKFGILVAIVGLWAFTLWMMDED
jgi:hypothetical protein